MKYLTKLIVAVAMVLTISNQSQAQNCNSVGSVASDIFSKVHNVAVQAGCAVANATGFIAYDACFTSNAINNLTGQLVSFWNSKVNSSWATLGPRRLERNKNLNGTIVGTTGRMFVSFPIFNKNSVTITINETGGKGKTSVTVCKVNNTGQKTNIGTKWFNDNKDRKKKSNEKRTFRVNGAKNHIITVHFDGKSVGNTFKYKLRSN